MNFEFSESQKMIQDQSRQFLTQHSPLTVGRKVVDDGLAYDKELWKQIAEMGWCGTAIPEEYGGLGLGYLELCVIAEEMGRSLAPVPFYSNIYLAAEILKDAGNEEQKQTHLPAIAAAEKVYCLALAERAGQSQLSEPQAKVVDGKLTGSKIAVLDGIEADYAIVSATDSGNSSLYLVELGQSGVSRDAANSIDPSRPLASITFDGASAELLGDAGSAQALLGDAFTRAAVFTAFEQIGGCDAAMQMGIEYTGQRYAFGRAIASFQAIKHIFADMYVATELARSNAYYAAWALQEGDAQLPLAAAAARTSGNDAYYFCTKENIEAHGGMGFTWEFDCHLYYKRAQLLSTVIGGSRYWNEQVAAQVLSQPQELVL